MLARTSGWAPVVFNDALRTRRDAHTAGEKVSDTQVQPRVVTLAKSTPARRWLGGVAPVVLVAACRDARRAYRSWFDFLAGAGKGRKVGHPRFRSRKDNRAWIRLTRNGLGAAAGGVRVVKVGDVRLVWSRVLPSVPSSVTVIRVADGAVLRIVGGRGDCDATTPDPQRCRDRPWPDQAGGLVYRRGHRQPRAAAPRGAGAGPAAEGTGQGEGVEAGCQGGRSGCCPAP